MSSEEESKRVEYYSALVNAWINTRFEHDRSLLTLSTAAIGGLIGLLGVVGVGSIEGLVLYVFSLLSFSCCCILILLIFKRNASHLEKVVAGDYAPDPFLNAMDRMASNAFILGVVLSVVLGVSVGANSLFLTKEKKMSDQNRNDENVKHVQTEEITLKKSLNDISNLRPPEPKPEQPKEQPKTKG